MGFNPKKDLDLVMAMFPTLGFTGFVFKKILDIFNTDTSKQAKAAEELIKAGKENGVDEMEIKLKQFAGGKLNIPEDFNIDVQIGKSEETVIKVKYKYTSVRLNFTKAKVGDHLPDFD